MSGELHSKDEIVGYCSDLYNRTRTLWRSLEGQYPTWECRFSILYGPPILRPDLLILGSNPGFDPDDLYPEEILTWPKDNEYTTQDWPLARRLRSIFASADLDYLLERSLGTNLIFFKSKCLGRHKETGLGWADNPLEIRRQLETYCAQEVGNLVEALEPKAVLVLGLAVFDKVTDEVVPVLGAKDRRVAAIGWMNGTKTFGMIHPTGAQVSNWDWSIVTKVLATELGGT